jgi:hypothetical protein
VPRYYFDIREREKFHPDEEGRELSSIETACDEAARSLADMAREAVRSEQKNSSDQQLSIEVRDGDGIVLEAKFTFEVIRRRRAVGSQHQRKIYQNENGDSWWLCRDAEAVFVLHEANDPSGGAVTRMEVSQFLASGRNPPEKQALLAMIGELAHCIE